LLSGRSVLVVGGSSGIGLAAALRLASRGERVALMARAGGALEAAAASCRAAGASEVVIVPADIGVEADVRRAVAAVVDAFDGLDAVVHTATVMAYGTVEETPAEVFTTVVDTAVHATLFLAQAVMPQFRRQCRGTFVIVNSLLGSVTVPNMGAYAAAKWGQRAIARTLQQEVRGMRGVHVCIVSPGSTNTPIYYQAANYTSKQARPPVPVVQPERVAASIVRLLDHPRGNVSVPVGPPNPIVITGFRLLPFLYDRLVGPLFRVAALTRRSQSPTAGNVLAPVAGQERVVGRWPDR
jgi:NAD(P)-dependent dehydrogenase (short-subunit alcohol dehydrogenase family)